MQDGANKTEPTITVVVPVLNEAPGITATLQALVSHRLFKQIVIVDGGSSDNTVSLINSYIQNPANAVFAEKSVLCTSLPGRARQMNAGAAMCDADVMLFLHADTVLPVDAAISVRDAVIKGVLWGHFLVRLDQPGVIYRLIEQAMNLRSRVTGIATGDQAVYVRSDVFRLIGGFPDIPLMEDIALATRLSELDVAGVVTKKVRTSARRWLQNGVYSTILSMWALRLLYWLGVSPIKLARYYYPKYQS